MGIPSRRSDDAAFRSFVDESSAALGRLANLLCGDRHFAQDLLQNCLIRMYQAWPDIRRSDAVAAYARQVLLRCWLNERRRPWRRAESRTGVVPDLADRSAAWISTDTRDVLRRALAEVPPRQRAAIILRYMNELSVAETADALRCTEGTVRSQTARGLVALRAALARLGVHSFDHAFEPEMCLR